MVKILSSLLNSSNSLIILLDSIIAPSILTIPTLFFEFHGSEVSNQENIKIAGESMSVKVKNADLSNQIKKSTAKIPPLENKIKDNQYLIETLKYEYGLLDKEKEWLI